MVEPTRDAREVQLASEGRALRRLARSLLDADEVDDVLQDAAVVALAPARAERPGPWLRGLVRNLALLRRRSQARRRARERLVARPAVDVAGDPAAIAMQTELMRDVAAAVHGLAEPYRSVVALRFWHGMLPAAIATRLALPRNTVRTRLQRGLAMLRAELDVKYGTRERWAAPLGVLVGVRAAVPAAVTGGGVLLFAGMLMKTKLLLGAGAVLLAAVAIPCWADMAAAPSHAPGKPEPGLASQAAGSLPAALQRVEITTPRPEASVGVAEGSAEPPAMARALRRSRHRGCAGGRRRHHRLGSIARSRAQDQCQCRAWLQRA